MTPDDKGLGVKVDHGKVPGYMFGGEVGFLDHLSDMVRDGYVDETLRKDIVEGIRSWDPDFFRRYNTNLETLSASLF